MKFKKWETVFPEKFVCLSCRQDILVCPCYSAKRSRRKLWGLGREQ